ncbi:hypothetical protein [Streptomyces sp. CBMA29]|uniref:hypothetical protein n=1 Tax=Streptomyces sp. CBMA29 TaxID=1896314 RepID=UPI001661AB01|nr:hypothetical protein [Streptomyces sp. CBMA29]
MAFRILEIRDGDDEYDVQVRGTHLAELALQVLPHLTTRELAVLGIAVLRRTRGADPGAADLLTYLSGISAMPDVPAAHPSVSPFDARAALAATTPALAAAAQPAGAEGLAAAASSAPDAPVPTPE